MEFLDLHFNTVKVQTLANYIQIEIQDIFYSVFRRNNVVFVFIVEHWTSCLSSSGYSRVHGSLPNQSLFSGFSGGSTGEDLKLDKLHFSAILEMPWSLPRRAETGTRKKEAWMSLLRLLDPNMDKQ